MKKYYRRLVWGLSILMSVIALGAMALMTKSRAEDIRDEFQRNASEAAHNEWAVYSSYQPTHPSLSEGDTLDPEFWDVFMIEKAYAAMAYGYGAGYAKSFGMSLTTGYYSDLFIDGEKASLSKSFLILYDKDWDEPLYAPIPEEFWEFTEENEGSNGDSYVVDAYRYSHMLDNAVRITGLRYQGMVYIETLELYDEDWFYDPDEEKYTEKYFTFDLSPYLHDVPSGAEPYLHGMVRNSGGRNILRRFFTPGFRGSGVSRSKREFGFGIRMETPAGSCGTCRIDEPGNPGNGR